MSYHNPFSYQSLAKKKKKDKEKCGRRQLANLISASQQEKG